MDDKNFDDIIKSKIEGFSSSEESDWSQFSSLLEQEENSDLAFDEKISSLFAEYEEPYQPNHWEILKEKLEIEEYIRTRLYLVKGIELSILILVYMGFASIFNPFDAIQQRLSTPVLMASQSSVSENSFVNASVESTLNSQIGDPLVIAKLNKEDAIDVVLLTRHTDDTKYSIETVRSLNIDNRSDILNMGIDEKLGELSRSIYSARNFEGHDVKNLSWEILDHDEETEISDQKKVYLANLETILNPFEYSFDVPSQTYGFVKLYSDKLDSDEGVYVNLTGSFNADIIDSPNDNVNPKYLSYKSYSEGYSVGIGIVNRFNNWNLGIGARYTQQAYSPRQISETTGGVSEGTKKTTLEKIAYDVVSLPINANYRFVNKNSWNLFAISSLSLNAIGTAAYVAQEEVNRRTVRRFNILDNNQVNQELDYLSQKDFNLGAFEGGPLLSNLYLTGSIGAGIEKKIGKNTFLSFSGQYRHHLFSAELGPNDDKIHTFSWTFGAKYRI